MSKNPWHGEVLYRYEDLYIQPISLFVVDPRANRGFTKIGRERVTTSNDREEVAALREAAPDCKESIIGHQKTLSRTFDRP